LPAKSKLPIPLEPSLFRFLAYGLTASRLT
jgi:hypothetical protein